MRESTVERYFINAVENKANGLAWKFTSPNRRGVPDRLVVLPEGRVWFVELKAPGEEISKQQHKRIQELLSKGALVRIISSKDDVDAFIREVCYGKI